MSMNRKQRRLQNKAQKPSASLTAAASKSALELRFEEGRDFSKAGQYAKATRIFADILKEQPTHVGALEELGVAAFKMRDYQKALSFFQGMKLVDPENIKANAYIGNTYVFMEKYEEAFDYLNLALNEWGKAFIHKALGNVYMYLGDKEKASHHYKTAYEMDPDNIEFLYSYIYRAVKLKSKEDPLFQTVTKLTKNKKPADQIHKNFILFKAYDDIGEHEKAFDYMLEAGKRVRETLPNIQENFHLYFEQIKQFFTKEFLESYAGKKHPTQKPVFILGMPRSGTTLLEQILHAHPDVAGIGEDTRFQELIEEHSFFPKINGAPYPLRQNPRHNRYISPYDIGQQYEDHIDAKTHGEKRVINKAITLFFEAGFIDLAYQSPKMIHIKRNAMDSCLSTFTQFFTNKAQPYSYNLTELGEYYKWYVELMAHWNNVLPGKILNVTYEDIVADIETEARRIIDFLELPWNESCLEFYNAKKAVRTASLEQVRQPIYTSSVGRWKKYGPKIAPLIEALGPAAPPEAKAYLEEIQGKSDERS
ncbi:MAG: sulfotransferase [Rhodospirillales bacterium]|nr:sulfotransferase [Rhodospirillales bacterium]